MSRFALILSFAVTAAPLLVAQQPFLNYRGIVNAASRLPQGLAGGAIARGSLFSISGANLGPATPNQQSEFPLQTTFGGVSLRIQQGATISNAIPISVSSKEIIALLPSDAPLGEVAVQAIVNNARSNFASFTVANSALGIRTVNGAGNGPGVIFNNDDETSPNSLDSPATPGQIVSLRATGLGPGLGPDANSPVDGDLPVALEIFVGGIAAPINSQARNGCCAGEDKITFQVPDDAPTGCWVPVFARTAKTTISNMVTMSISADGSACSDPANPLTDTFHYGGNIAILTLLRGFTRQEYTVRKPVDVTSDLFINTASQEPGGSFAFAPFLSEPPPGTCTLFLASGDYLGGNPLPGPKTSTRNLDFGGPILLTGPRGQRALNEISPGTGAGGIGASITGYGIPNRTYFDAGDYTLSATGGADVGPFDAQLTFAPPFVWTNAQPVIDRTKPLVLNWSGANDGTTLAAFGGTVDYPTNSTALFYCIAAPGATSISVPVEILSAIPATRANLLQSNSAVHLTNLPLVNSSPFTADGLDAGAARSLYLTGRTVVFR